MNFLVLFWYLFCKSFNSFIPTVFPKLLKEDKFIHLLVEAWSATDAFCISVPTFCIRLLFLLLA